MILLLLLLGLVAMALSLVATYLMMRIAPRIGFVDKPGHRKIHSNPKPLGGGVAIFLAIALPILAVLLYAWALPAPDWIDPHLVGGIRLQTAPVLVMLAAMLAMHVMGLLDDRRALGPYVKLIAQFAIVAGLVLLSPDLRLLSALGSVPSIVLTLIWIVAITNAFNFLDNMDGLSAGVGAVATIAFLVAAVSIGQWFVAATLVLLLGALLGFLCFNFAPARIFMGDSGSLLIGLMLGILTVRTTFLPPDLSWGAGWYAVFAPVIVLAVPLYDLIVVSIIRISHGKSPFVGDTNHLSHRLVARGMSRRTAVLCIYLITAATAAAAIILPHVQTPLAAGLIFVQTLLVLGVVALLEQHPLPANHREEAK